MIDLTTGRSDRRRDSWIRLDSRTCRDGWLSLAAMIQGDQFDAGETDGAQFDAGSSNVTIAAGVLPAETTISIGDPAGARVAATGDWASMEFVPPWGCGPSTESTIFGHSPAAATIRVASDNGTPTTCGTTVWTTALRSCRSAPPKEAVSTRNKPAKEARSTIRQFRSDSASLTIPQDRDLCDSRISERHPRSKVPEQGLLPT